MSPQQEQHLRDIKDSFLWQVDDKYRKGVQEHGGNLWEKSELFLIDEAMKECVDKYTYLYTAKQLLLERA